MTDARTLVASRRGALVATAGLATLATLTTTPARARSFDDILKARELRVGVNPTLPPRALFNDKNEIDGFEPELAKALAEKLGVKLTIVPLGRRTAFPSSPLTRSTS